MIFSFKNILYEVQWNLKFILRPIFTFSNHVLSGTYILKLVYIHPLYYLFKKKPNKKKQKHNKKQPTFKKYNLIQFIDI